LRSSMAPVLDPFLSRSLEGHFPSLDLVNSAVLIMGVWVCQMHIGLGSFGCVSAGRIPPHLMLLSFASREISALLPLRTLAVGVATMCVQGFLLGRILASICGCKDGSSCDLLHLYSSPGTVQSRLRCVRFIPGSHFPHPMQVDWEACMRGHMHRERVFEWSLPTVLTRALSELCEDLSGR
jgi:hypothetical protein